MLLIEFAAGHGRVASQVPLAFCHAFKKHNKFISQASFGHSVESLKERKKQTARMVTPSLAAYIHFCISDVTYNIDGRKCVRSCVWCVCECVCVHGFNQHHFKYFVKRTKTKKCKFGVKEKHSRQKCFFCLFCNFLVCDTENPCSSIAVACACRYDQLHCSCGTGSVRYNVTMIHVLCIVQGFNRKMYIVVSASTQSDGIVAAQKLIYKFPFKRYTVYGSFHFGAFMLLLDNNDDDNDGEDGHPIYPVRY